MLITTLLLLGFISEHISISILILILVTANAAELLKNPQLVAAVQAKLNGLVGIPTGFIETLPECIKKRLNALKNIQVECAQLEGKFYEEAHQLEMKYAELFKPLYNKRTNIVNALYEPTEEEATWVEPGEDEEEKIDEEQDEKSKEKPAEEKTEEEKMAESVLNQLKLDENTKGIPEFWLTAMKNVELIEEMIQVSSFSSLFSCKLYVTVNEMSAWHSSCRGKRHQCLRVPTLVLNCYNTLK